MSKNPNHPINGKLPATICSANIPDDMWSGVYLGAKMIGNNIMPVLPDGKLLNGFCSCSVESSTRGITTMTITVELRTDELC